MLNTTAWKRWLNNRKQKHPTTDAVERLAARLIVTVCCWCVCYSSNRWYIMGTIVWLEWWWFKRLGERRQLVWKPCSTVSTVWCDTSRSHLQTQLVLTEGLMGLINTNRNYHPAANKPPFFRPSWQELAVGIAGIVRNLSDWYVIVTV